MWIPTVAALEYAGQWKRQGSWTFLNDMYLSHENELQHLTFQTDRSPFLEIKCRKAETWRTQGQMLRFSTCAHMFSRQKDSVFCHWHLSVVLRKTPTEPGWQLSSYSTNAYVGWGGGEFQPSCIQRAMEALLPMEAGHTAQERAVTWHGVRQLLSSRHFSLGLFTS